MENSSDTPVLVLLTAQETVIPLREGVNSLPAASCHFVRIGRRVRVYDKSDPAETLLGDRPADGQLLTDGQLIQVGERKVRFHAHRPQPQPMSPRIPAMCLRVGVLVLLCLLWWRHTANEAAWRKDKRTSQSHSDSQRALQQALRSSLRRDLRAQQTDTDRARSDNRALQAQLERGRTGSTRLRGELTETREQARLRQAALDRMGQDLRKTRLTLDELDRHRQQLDLDNRRLNAALTRLRAQRTRQPPMKPGKQLQQPTPVQKPKPPRRLTQQEVEATVESGKNIIDNYANPAIGSHSLAPVLRKLQQAGGDAPASGTIALYRHARLRLDSLRSALAINRSGLAALRRKLGRRSTRPGQISTGTKETKQRRHDWLARLVEIRTEQAERLGGIVSNLLTSYVELSDPGAVQFLIDEFVRQAKLSRSRRDLALIQRLCELFVSGRIRAAIPVLIDHLTVRDKTLQALVRATLLGLCGATTKATGSN